MARGISKFDKMFSSLIGEQTPAAAQSGGPSPRKKSRAAEVEKQIQKAMALFHAARYAHSLNEVRKVEAIAGEDPRVASLLGACNALVSGQLRPGIERCAEIIEQTFYIPDLYCTLGVLLVKSRHRAKAYKVFRKGLQFDPHHPALQAHIREMGLRRRPVIRFLGRSHLVNRTLGMVRARLSPA